MDQADEPADAAASDADPQVADAVSTLEGAVDWFTKAGSDSTNEYDFPILPPVPWPNV